MTPSITKSTKNLVIRTADNLIIGLENNDGNSNGENIRCFSAWECNDWGECISGRQARECSKKIRQCNAGTKPETVKACSIEQLSNTLEGTEAGSGERPELNQNQEEKDGNSVSAITGSVIGSLETGEFIGAVIFIILIAILFIGIYFIKRR